MELRLHSVPGGWDEGGMVMKARLVPQTILGFVLVVLVCSDVAGLNPSRKISQYGHNMWRIQDGYLPAPPEAIAQTGDGYLWIGTDAGLVRFDGVRFVSWASLRREKLPSDQILYLLAASDGSLWIGTGKGLARWKDGTLTTYKSLANRIWGIVEDHGDIWIVRSRIEDTRGPLCRITDSDLRCFGRDDGIPLPTAAGVALDSSGNFWISGNQGLCKWKPGGSAVYFHRDLAERGYLMGVDALSVLNESHVWIGLQQPNGNLQLQELDHGEWTAHPLPKAQRPPPSTNVLFSDPEGALWIGTASDGVYRIFDDKTDHFSTADGLSSDSVERFFQDREGVLWVASTKGIDSFRDLPVVSYSIKEGLVSDSVSSILASHDGGVWIGGAEALGSLKQDKLSAIRTNYGLPGRDITTMSEDRRGRLWIGVDSSLSVLDQGRFFPIHKPDGSQLGIVFGIAEDAAGDEWAMTEDKVLFRIENLKIRQQMSLPQKCFSIAGESKEGVWLGCVNGDLTHYYKGRSETFPRVSSTNIRQLLPEPGGGMWAVAEDALIWWNDNKTATMTTRNGLPCNELYAAVKDNAGALWLYARCGLFSVDASQLILWHENPSIQVKVASLDVYCGAQPGITPLQPQATRSLDGRLWFANNNVMQSFDPHLWRRNALPPNVVVERVAANGVSYPILHALKLPALVRNLDIDYTALSFVVPQKVRFRYRLDGYDTKWSEPVSRREVSYTNLPPGDYEFRVIACNNDGVWNEAGASLAFSVAPAWFQTNWFRIACVGAFLILMRGLYQLRLQQLHRQFNVRLEERTRIARELHDTLLQSLHGLMFEFQAVRNMFHRRPEEALHALDGAITGTERAITESQVAIEGLRDAHVAENDLAQLLRATGEELVASRCVDHDAPTFGLTVEGERRTLVPVTRDEVYRIAREVLRNAFRHAHARRIEAEILYDEHQFRLRVRDDGKGMDPQVLEKGGRAGHWGLPGVRERAQQMGAKMDIWSEAGAGTEVQLTVAAAIAYEKTRDRSGLRLFRRTRNHDRRS